MKNVLKLFVSLLFVTLLCFSSVAEAQTWTLTEGLRASIPDPNNLATAQNPVTVGNAKWYFRNGGGTAPYTTAVKTSDLGGAFVELPEGAMWYNTTGALAGMGVYDAPQPTPSPCGAGPCTSYGLDDTGGYTHTGVIWETLTGGTFKVTWGGYSGRAFVSEPERTFDMVLFAGAFPNFNSDPNPPRTGPFVDSFGQNGHLGSANALMHPQSETFNLLPGEAVDLYINGAGPGDWAGLILTIETVISDTDLTISTDPAGITTVTPFANETQSVVPEVPIAIEASRFVDCPTVWEFDRWVADSGATIADPNSAATTVTVTTSGVPGAITAHYVDASQCGDECHESVASDITGPGDEPDCIVDLLDFSLLSSQFLIDNSVQ